MTVYLDHAATTPMRRRAVEAYAAAAAAVGNPSSIHTAGQSAKRMLEEARETIATGLGVSPIEVVFTSGGTEAVNLALKGLYWARNADASRPRILAPEGEHHATIDTLEWLQTHEGAVVEWLPLDADGRVRTEVFRQALASDPGSIALATVIWANNEVGAIQPVSEIAEAAAGFGVPLHTDAVAAFGQIPLDIDAVRRESGSGTGGLVAASVSAHKIGGPVGAGALVLSRHAQIIPLIHGGGQQRNVRSGTQDVPAACAFATAASETVTELDAYAVRVGALRDRLLAGVRELVPEAVVNGPADTDARLPGNAHFTFPGCEGDSLLFLLDAAGVAVSTGSACQAGIPEPSHVLRAMGRDEARSRGALRVTLGHDSTDADVDAFLAALPAAFAQASRAGFADRAVSMGGV